MSVYATARELIADPARFCRGAFARDAQGAWCHYLDAEAFQFCLLGALQRAHGQSIYGTPIHHALEAHVFARHGTRALATWADGCTHAEALSVLGELARNYA